MLLSRRSGMFNCKCAARVRSLRNHVTTRSRVALALVLLSGLFCGPVLALGQMLDENLVDGGSGGGGSQSGAGAGSQEVQQIVITGTRPQIVITGTRPPPALPPSYVRPNSGGARGGGGSGGGGGSSSAAPAPQPGPADPSPQQTANRPPKTTPTFAVRRIRALQTRSSSPRARSTRPSWTSLQEANTAWG